MPVRIYDVRSRDALALPPGPEDLRATAIFRIDRGPRFHLEVSPRYHGLAVVTGGRCEHRVGGRRVELTAGGCYLTVIGQAICQRSLGHGHRVTQVVLEGRVVPELVAATVGGPGAWDCDALASVGASLDAIWHEARAARPHCAEVCAGRLRAALWLLRRATTTGRDGDPSRRLFERARALIDGRYAELPGVAAVAEAVGVSGVHLARVFRRHAATTPQGYLEARRIDHAKALLELGGLGVAEVAAELGYASPFTFSRAFKRVTGRAPSAWRSA